MSRNILIVESDNDKFFIEALIQNLQQNINLKIEPPICNIDDYECLDGLSEKKLKSKLEDLKDRIFKDEDINKVGIILDADSVGVDKRVELIDRVLNEIFELETNLKTINQFVKDREYNVEFGCYITNIDGIGELETLLKELACRDHFYANCLESWRECLKNREMKQKDFDKLWIQIYQRYDCCNSKEKKQASRKCNNEISMQKGIYDFNHTSLDNLKAFLYKFN